MKEDEIVLEDELKNRSMKVGRILPVHKKQLLAYLRLADKKVAPLMNFGDALIKRGISRFVNGRQE